MGSSVDLSGVMSTCDFIHVHCFILHCTAHWSTLGCFKVCNIKNQKKAVINVTIRRLTFPESRESIYI